MGRFLEYWTKGLVVCFMIIFANFIQIVWMLPALIIMSFTGLGKDAGYLVSIILSLIFIPPFTYFAFKVFYGKKIIS